jgi:hypothetical protein
MESVLTPLVEKFLGQGLIGAVLVAHFFISRDLLQKERAATQVEREEKRAAQAEVARLNGLMQDRMVPALVNAASAVGDAQKILASIQYRQDVATEAAKKGGTGA